jgi:hypothetical protein
MQLPSSALGTSDGGGGTKFASFIEDPETTAPVLSRPQFAGFLTSRQQLGVDFPDQTDRNGQRAEPRYLE